MSSFTPNSSLSLSTRLLCYLGPPTALLLTATTSPTTALLSPLSLVPSAWFYKKWKKHSGVSPARHAELEPLIWTFTLTGTVGLAAAAVIQLGICQVITTALFGSGELQSEFWAEFSRSTLAGLSVEQVHRRADLAASWQNWVFNGALTYLAAGFVEETLKYTPLLYARRQDRERKQRRDRAYVDYTLAGALGFSVVENLGFIHTACETGRESWPKVLLTFLERVVLGQIGHLSVVCLTALRATRRDYHGDNSLGFWGVVAPAALFHGTYNFVLMSASALDGNVGWIHPQGTWKTVVVLGLASGMMGVALQLAKQEWKKVMMLESKHQGGEKSEKQE